MFTDKSRLQYRSGNNPEEWTDVSNFGQGLPVNIFNNLVTSNYDYVSLSYTGDNLTGVVFKIGGSGGTTVATLTLAYDGNDNLISVIKS